MQDGKTVKVRSQAEHRVSRVLRDLRHVGKLARHQFSEAEVTQMFAAMSHELEAVQGLFAPREKPAQAEFKFE